jgi:hypothetical protein
MEAGLRFLSSLPLRAEWARKAKVVMIALAALFMSQDANPVYGWSVGNRDYQSMRDPIRSVINWDLYAGFHQDHKTPSLYIKKHISPGDRILALGPPHMLAIYQFYLGRVHYAVGGPRDFKYHQVSKDGQIVALITGSEILESLENMKEIVEATSGGGIWLLGDRLLLLGQNPSYPKDMQEYVRLLARDPDYVGFDGQTFVVKLR